MVNIIMRMLFNINISTIYKNNKATENYTSEI